MLCDFSLIRLQEAKTAFCECGSSKAALGILKTYEGNMKMVYLSLIMELLD